MKMKFFMKVKKKSKHMFKQPTTLNSLDVFVDDVELVFPAEHSEQHGQVLDQNVEGDRQ